MPGRWSIELPVCRPPLPGFPLLTRCLAAHQSAAERRQNGIYRLSENRPWSACR
ncbi:MAG: hypothetical protein KatS3mg110_0658 [Pirellulaceae bacterium]|nr:MAG: hypothetical protein KatS3mg110_0658 [Pirellulaceae bacterium]